MIGAFVAWSERVGSPGWVLDGNGCHIWTGARNGQGYPQVRANGRTQHVHRVRYEREVGPIPPGLQLDHYICDRGPDGCCNPFHCRPVTGRENMLRSDTIAARNAAKQLCPAGHPLSEGNLDRWQARRGGRKCRICKAALQRLRVAANRDAINAKKRAAYHRMKSCSDGQ